MSTIALTRQILSKMSGIGKWQREFFICLLEVWLRLRGRYNFDNLARQSLLSSVTYRKWFMEDFDFQHFNKLLYDYVGNERLFAFDPSYISKSGKHTDKVGYFWSGCAGAIKWGLEIAGIALLDICNHTAFHYYATQTDPKHSQNLIQYYASLIEDLSTAMLSISRYIAVDAYFAKFTFIDPVCKQGFEVITRLRDDAFLRYRYLGVQTKGRGRPKTYAGKVLPKQLDMQHFRPCLQGDNWIAYQAVVHARALKRWVKLVVVHTFNKDGSLKSAKLFISTDKSLDGADILLYYHMRFQIEFLYRDAKQFLGLNHCQSRKEERLGFHFNFSLTALSIAKIVHWMSQPSIERKPFSIQDIKTQYFNEHLLGKFIDGFGICPKSAINNPCYQDLVNYAKIAA